MEYKDITNSQIEDYIRNHTRLKFIGTYDCLPRLMRILGERFMEMRIVVDEFHVLLNDCAFKVYTEKMLLDTLIHHPYVTWLSATPCLDEILEEIPTFNGKTIYQLDWADRQKVNIIRVPLTKPIDGAMRIVEDYQNGRFPTKISANGDKVVSRTCVIFVNSVTAIVNIVKGRDLRPEDVNIICAINEDNTEVISRLGEGFMIGDIPGRGEPQKMITLCTSTCFCGCDFYGEDTSTYVISNCKKANTAIDISTELPQICGRQRLDSNPFRNDITFIYSTWDGEVELDKMLDNLKKKQSESDAIRQYFNNAPECVLKELKRMVKTDKSMNNDDNNFVFFDETSKQFGLNDLSVLAERYQIYVQHSVYHDSNYVMQNLNAQDGFNVSESIHQMTITEHLKYTLFKRSFTEKMKAYCKYREEKAQNKVAIDFLISDFENQNEMFRKYYDELGHERIKALAYREAGLKNEMKLKQSLHAVELAMSQAFKTGEEYTIEKIKSKMNAIYRQMGVEKKGKKSDMEKLYGFKLIEHNKVSDTGTRKRVYEIIGKK